MTLLLGLLAALAPAPPASPPAPLQQTAAERYDAASRVARVAYRLAVNSPSACPRAAPVTGLMFHHLLQYPAADRPQLARAFGLGQGPGILAVAAGSPADRAGLRAGDVLTMIDGAPASISVVGAEGDLKAAATLETALERALDHDRAMLTILRGTQTLRIELFPERGCPLRVRVANSRTVNAYADGATIVITNALLEYTRSDDELAVILAHEFSHNLLDHRDRIAALQGGKRASASQIRVLEAEADRLSVRHLLAGRYDPAVAPALWARLPRAKGRVFNAHPNLKQRTALWRRALDEEIIASAFGRR